MFKKIKKAYRIACVMFGKRKVWLAILGVAAAVFGFAYANNFRPDLMKNRFDEFIENGDGADLVNKAKEVYQYSLSDLGIKESAAVLLSAGDVNTPVRGEIKKISDGDTITVTIDGTDQKIRMLEVDTPESVHVDSEKNNAFGIEASEYTKSKLSVGQTVWLTKDKSDTDRYGRLLRLVWTEEPQDIHDETELRNKCYNARLLLDGYAEVAIFDDKAYQDIFTRFQEEAMRDRRGLWADEAWWEFLGLK